MQNNKIDWKRAIILGGAFMATCIGSGFATGSEFLSFFVAHGIPGAIGAIAISLIIYFLFTKELFNKGQEVTEADQHNILAYYFGKTAGEVFDWFSAILVGGCYLIMLNGAGTTLNQYLDWDPLIGACLMRIVWIWTIFRWVHTLEALYISYPISWFITAAVHCVCYLALWKKLRGRIAERAPAAQ